MSGCIIVSDANVDKMIHFSRTHHPGGFFAKCKRQCCNTFCTGSENEVKNWAEAHTYEHLESDLENEEYKQIYSETDEKYPEMQVIGTDLVELVTEALWSAYEDYACADRNLNRTCDTADHPDFRMEHVARRVIDTLAANKIITTVEQLDALPLPTPDHLAGVLIKCTALVDPDNGRYGLGDVYERNTDGTWCMLQDPSGADWGERQVASKDIPLPAIVLWVPVL